MLGNARLCLTVAAMCLWAPLASAAVKSQNANGFTVAFEADVSGDAQNAYEKFLAIASWWNSDHTHSGDSKNLTMEARNGGCWCEALPNGGFVRHMEIVHAAPGQLLVLSGGLGPLARMAVSGAMVISFEKKGETTHVTLNYSAGGYDAKEFKVMAKAVDGVIGIQFKRYANLVSTGQP